MTRRREFIAAAACAVSAAAAPGCKRNREAETPEVWDDAPVPERAEALAKLAPPWPRPDRAELDNGLLKFWLHEPDARASHARLMLPTTIPNGQDAALSACCAEVLRFELSRRLGRVGVDVTVHERFGRLEVALHGPDATLAASVRALSITLGRADPTKSLLVAKQRLAKQLGTPTTAELATGGLTATLLGLTASSQWIEPTRLAALDTPRLLAAWEWITSPRRAVFVVHAGVAASALPKVMTRLGSAWTAKDRAPSRQHSVGVLGRLRPKVEPGGARGLLASDTPPPLLSVTTNGIGNPTLCMGRLIPTANPRARAIARLAHRVAQEEHDVQFALLGPYALLTARDALPPASTAADRRVKQTLEELTELAKTRQPQRRLFSATQLWLGARVVQASIDGEDWTSLFSESIELADKDDELPRALARDATLMLSIEPEELVAWTKRWLDPSAGDPGWAWVVAGADARMLAGLGRATKAKTSPL